MNIGAIINELRIEKNLTQAQLANVLGITQDSISLWERGKRFPDTTYVVKLADFFQVSADYLLGRCQEPEIIFAQPQSELTREEQQLLKDFRALSRHSRELILGMIHSAAEKEQRV